MARKVQIEYEANLGGLSSPMRVVIIEKHGIFGIRGTKESFVEVWMGATSRLTGERMRRRDNHPIIAIGKSQEDRIIAKRKRAYSTVTSANMKKGNVILYIGVHGYQATMIISLKRVSKEDLGYVLV